ncbi:proteoglycan 4-like, partial [Penaeus indicus]|uniref:proteoglycan 4-like n=1 Tax=Penaeus indicus TaxID=29960 RepID=UPI00300C0659
MDLDIFEVHRKIIEVCQHDPHISPQRDGSLIVEVSSPDESDRLRAICNIPGAQVSCSPHKTLYQCKAIKEKTTAQVQYAVTTAKQLMKPLPSNVKDTDLKKNHPLPSNTSYNTYSNLKHESNAENASGEFNQKRTRSEGSIEETPPPKLRSLEPSGKAPQASPVTAPAATTSTGASAARQKAPEPEAQVHPLPKQRNTEPVQKTPSRVGSLEPSGKAPEASTMTASAATTSKGASAPKQNAPEAKAQASKLKPIMEHLMVDLMEEWQAKARRVLKEARRTSWRQYVSSINSGTPLAWVWDKVCKIVGKSISMSTPALQLNGIIITDQKEVANELAKSMAIKEKTTAQAQYAVTTAKQLMKPLPSNVKDTDLKKNQNAENASGEFNQKRTRSEGSIEETPPPKLRSLEPSGKAPQASPVTAPAATTSTGASAARQKAPEPEAQVHPLPKQRNTEPVQKTPSRVGSLEPSGKAPQASPVTAPAATTSTGASAARQKAPEPEAQVHPLPKQRNTEPVQKTPSRVGSLEPSGKAPQASPVTAPAATTSTGASAARQKAPEPEAQVHPLPKQRNTEPVQKTPSRVGSLEPSGKAPQASP